MAFNDNCAPILEVDKGVQRSHVFGRLVRGCQIVQEQPWLEQGVLENLKNSIRISLAVENFKRKALLFLSH